MPSPRLILRSALRATAVVVLAALAVVPADGVASAGAPPRAGHPRHSPTASPEPSRGDVRITDDSHVLSRADRAGIRSAATASAPDSPSRDVFWVYTTTKRGDDKNAFDRYYEDLLGSAPPDVVIIAVNTESRHIIITSGPVSALSDAAADRARARFTDDYRSAKKYGSALAAAVRSIETSVTDPYSPPPSPPAFPLSSPPVHQSHDTGAILFVVLIIFVMGLIALASKAGGGSTGRRPYSSSRPAFYRDSSTTFVTGSGFDSGGGSDWNGGGDSGGGSDWSGGDSGGGSDGNSGGDSGGGTSSGDF